MVWSLNRETKVDPYGIPVEVSTFSGSFTFG